MPLADLKIIGIVCRGDLDDAGTKFRVDVVISDYPQLPVENRQNRSLTDVLLVALILGVDGQCRITQHRLRTRGSSRQILILPFQFIPNIP